MTRVELDGSCCSSSVVSVPAVNFIQNHNKNRDEHMVDVREHGNIERVLSQQDIGGSVLTAYLQHKKVEYKICYLNIFKHKIESMIRRSS